MPFVNLFLDDELHAALKERAKAVGVPLYKLIPDILDVQLAAGVYAQDEQIIDGNTGEILEPTTKKSSLDLLVEERADIDFGLNFKPVPKPQSGRKRAKTREKTADMSDNVE